MSRKKKHEHVNHERWLVSYADFITLLFAFFVVLFASSQSDRNKQRQMAEAMQHVFSRQGIFEAHSTTPALSSSGGANGKPLPIAIPSMMAEMERLKRQMDDSYHEARKSEEKKHGSSINGRIGQGDTEKLPFSIQTNRDGVVISLQDAGFFDSGSAEIRPDSLPVLECVARNLPPSRIRVEGHTDNVAIHGGVFRSNWELSTARAAAIARVLLERGVVNPTLLSIAGYGEYHPVASNATEDGRARNRRVDIVLMRDDAPLQAVAAASPLLRPTPSR